MGRQSIAWLAQEAARVESLYAQRVKLVGRASSFREVLRLRKVPPRPDLRAFELRGPQILERAVVTRLVELANCALQRIESTPGDEAKAAAYQSLLKDAAILEKSFAWLFRQVSFEGKQLLK